MVSTKDTLIISLIMWYCSNSGEVGSSLVPGGSQGAGDKDGIENYTGRDASRASNKYDKVINEER